MIRSERVDYVLFYSSIPGLDRHQWINRMPCYVFALFGFFYTYDLA